MRNVNTVLIRYFGADWNRYHCLQRGDGMFWTGEGWSSVLDCARTYRLHKDAQIACAALQRCQYGGKPMRTFKMEVVVALVADDVHEISTEQLAEFIGKAVRLDVESSLYGDGPVEDSFVQLQLRLATLEETQATRNRF